MAIVKAMQYDVDFIQTVTIYRIAVVKFKTPSTLNIPVVQCPVPDQGVEAALVTANRTYQVTETANYTCSNNAAVVISGSLYIQCEPSGEWSDSPPVCGM